MPIVAEISPCVLDTQELLGRCLGKSELALRVLTRFQKQLTDDLSQVQQAVEAGEADVIARVAHRIKGAAANVSARLLREDASVLESLARSSNWGEIPSAVEALCFDREEFEAALPQLS